MTLFRIVKLTVINRQIGDCADVEIMCLAVASAVKGEFAVINRESAGRPCPAEQTILVVVEITIVEGQIAALIANSGAVGIRYLGTGKLKVVNRNIAAGDENRLAVRDQAGRYH